jgi:hypothetical protein
VRISHQDWAKRSALKKGTVAFAVSRQVFLFQHLVCFSWSNGAFAFKEGYDSQ